MGMLPEGRARQGSGSQAAWNILTRKVVNNSLF